MTIVLAIVVCSACGLESEQDVDTGSLYIMQCSCSKPDLDGPELVEYVAEEDEPIDLDEVVLDD